MDPLTQALQALMSFLGGSAPMAGPPSPGGAPGAGAPGGPGTPAMGGMNLQSLLSLLTSLGGGYYGMNELKNMQRLYEEQRANAALAMNPSALGKRAAAAAFPLNKQLEYAVMQPVNSDLARRGMTQAPGAQASAEASALAPFEQENLRSGVQMAEFGFPFVQNLQSPDYLNILNQLNQFGRSSSFTAPTGTPGTGP